MARVAKLYPCSVQPTLFRSVHRMATFSTSNQFDKDIDYYKALGVTSSATQKDIKKKFHELAKKYHPDAANSRPSDEERFKKISEAYDILSNEAQKRLYDSARRSEREQ